MCYQSRVLFSANYCSKEDRAQWLNNRGNFQILVLHNIIILTAEALVLTNSSFELYDSFILRLSQGKCMY